MSTQSNTPNPNPASMTLVEAEPVPNNHKPVRRRAQSVQPPRDAMGMLAIAVSQGANMDVIERLVALQERQLARDAELQFNDAMNRAQTALGPIQADLTNPQTRSKYASYAALDRKVRPVYTREGLALSFDTADSPLPEHVRVLCFVSGFGHTKTYHVDMPSDGKGARGGDVMSKTHATASAMSYGMRYLVKMIFNIAVGEDDNDGNVIKMGELAKHLECIEAAANIADLRGLYQSAMKAAVKAKDTAAVKAIKAATDRRQAELTVTP